MPHKILFIQHAGGLGGSAYSLLYTLQGLRDAGDECVVLLARPTGELATLYREAGFEVIADQPLALIDHSTVALRPLWRPGTHAELIRAWVATPSLDARLAKILAASKCDLVHLNSMPLVPVAHVLNKMKVPYAWHVREPPPDQGVRTRAIRTVMRRCRGLIFLSAYDRRTWMGNDQGEVISNFVPDRFFNSDGDREPIRRALGIEPAHMAVLFLGGAHPAKGGTVLLDAIGCPELASIPITWLIPNAVPAAPHRFVSKVGRRVLAGFGSGPYPVRFYNHLLRLSKDHRIVSDSFRKDILPYFVAADVVLFPATRPHFARPVIEAAAVGRAVIASDIGGVNELVDSGSTGLLIQPARSADLAGAIRQLAVDAPLRVAMGRRGQILAQDRFRLAPQVASIRAVHQRVRAAVTMPGSSQT